MVCENDDYPSEDGQTGCLPDASFSLFLFVQTPKGFEIMKRGGESMKVKKRWKPGGRARKLSRAAHRNRSMILDTLERRIAHGAELRLRAYDPGGHNESVA